MYCEGYDGSEDDLRVVRKIFGTRFWARSYSGVKGRCKKIDGTVTAWRQTGLISEHYCSVGPKS